VTVVTTAFEETMRGLFKDNGVSETALVVTEHPIAGHNPEGIKKKVDKDLPLILKAATQWQPSGK
jgi:hypothetical protein